MPRVSSHSMIRVMRYLLRDQGRGLQIAGLCLEVNCWMWNTDRGDCVILVIGRTVSGHTVLTSDVLKFTIRIPECIWVRVRLELIFSVVALAFALVAFVVVRVGKLHLDQTLTNTPRKTRWFNGRTNHWKTPPHVKMPIWWTCQKLQMTKKTTLTKINDADTVHSNRFSIALVFWA